MNYEAVIGLEIHVELKTKSKMFSSAPVTYGAEPSSAVVPLDMAFPGTLPQVNKEAVKDAIMVANALHMDIDRLLLFDRKNYFYSDLPKGYQITQNEHPIGKKGYLDLDIDGEIRRIRVERLHLEEDTCMQHHLNEYTLVDYNRAGVPLIEIVSEPDMRTGLEAMKYVETIRSIVVYTGVSDGKMEEGSLRCDVNVSLRPVGSKTFGTKVEIKNLNSISHIQKALDFEIERQKKLLDEGKEVRQETRRYDEVNRETVLMRVKTDAVDYKYFREANILPIELSEEFVEAAIKATPELAKDKKARFMKDYDLSDYDATLLVSDKKIAQYYDECAKLTKRYKPLANWINVDVASYLNKTFTTIDNLPITQKDFVELIELTETKDLSSGQARQVFQKMLSDGCTPKAAKKALGITSQVSDPNVIKTFVDEVLNEFPDSIADYKAGKDRALAFMVGQIMKKSHGKVNPKMASDFLVEELKRR